MDFNFGAPILFSLLSGAILTLAYAAIYVSVSQTYQRSPLFPRPGAQRDAPSIAGAHRSHSADLDLLHACRDSACRSRDHRLCVYAVASPACVVEKIGPIKAMSRSAFLTKGNRWRIFGLIALLLSRRGSRSTHRHVLRGCWRRDIFLAVSLARRRRRRRVHRGCGRRSLRPIAHSPGRASTSTISRQCSIRARRCPSRARHCEGAQRRSNPD